MSEQTIILKNLLSEDIIIADLGYKLLSEETSNITNQFSYEDLCNSSDIKTLISAESLVINDGVSDLSVDDALNYLKRINTYYILNNFYTKTQLSNNTAGVSVDYNNIANSPIIEPVKYRLLKTDTSAPETGTEGDIYANTDWQEYYKYSNDQQNYIGDISHYDRVIIREYSNEEILFQEDGQYNSTGTTPSKNDQVIVEDDGNGTPAMYIYGTTSQSLFTSVELGTHLDGIGQKHEADEIGIVSELTDLEISSGENLDTVLSTVDTEFGLINTNLSNLNSDITTTSDNLNTEITNRSNADSTLQTQIDSLSGNFLISNGILYIKNTTKGKYLANPISLSYSKIGSTKNTYLYIDEVPSSVNGYKLNSTYTLTGISFSNENTVADSTIIISKNDNNEVIASIELSSDRFKTDNTLNVDIDTDDYIKVYIEYGSSLEAVNPIVILYFSQYGGTI